MSINDLNWNEAGLHRVAGWGAMLVGMPWLLTRREINQNPPENKKNPVLYKVHGIETLGYKSFGYITEDKPIDFEYTEYWSATRVRDSQKDTHDYAIGFSIAWPFIFGLGLLVGWRLLP